MKVVNIFEPSMGIVDRNFGIDCTNIVIVFLFVFYSNFNYLIHFYHQSIVGSFRKLRFVALYFFNSVSEI